MPLTSKDPREGVDPLLLFTAALSKNWDDPASVENVITSPSAPALVSDPEAEFDHEYRMLNSPGYRDRLERNTHYHREIFLKRGKVGLYTNWVQFIAHTAYDSRGRCGAIPGEKAVFLNPRTRYENIEEFIAAIRG